MPGGGKLQAELGEEALMNLRPQVQTNIERGPMRSHECLQNPLCNSWERVGHMRLSLFSRGNLAPCRTFEAKLWLECSCD